MTCIKIRHFPVDPEVRGKKFGEIIFPGHICGAMNTTINQQWWWHTKSEWGM
jgi:hypothetical protein